MGPFPIAIQQLKFLVVDIDYFTKWVEAEALATIMEKKCEALYGGTSSAGTVYLEYWSQTMGSSLTPTHSETFAHS